MDLPHIQSFGFTCRDADAQARWYAEQFGFDLISRQEHRGDAYGSLLGLPGSHLLRLVLAAGEERLELLEVRDPGPGARGGRPVPPDSRSSDLWFQHICLVVPAMQALAPRIEAQIGSGTLRPISSGPQLLPEWNRGAAGIVAFKFHDPEGHPLELLQFPADKGDPRWHQPSTAPVLGLDHSAIGISDPERSSRFYGELLGIPAGGGGINSGPEQDRLDGLEGTDVQIGAWRPRQGPGIETLAYRAPAGGRPRPSDSGAQDLIHWQIRLIVSDLASIAAGIEHFGGRALSAEIVELDGALEDYKRALQIEDPDGHQLQLVSH